MEENIRKLVRNLRSERYLLDYSSGNINTTNDCLPEYKAPRTALAGEVYLGAMSSRADEITKGEGTDG